MTIHHSSYRVDFILDGEVEEVGVDDDTEGRTEVGVVVEEQRGGYLWVRKSGKDGG